LNSFIPKEFHLKKNQFIKDLGAKDDVTSPFLVKYIAGAEGKDGKSYLNIILSDNSGEIESRKWQGAELALQKIKAGDIVIVSGKMNQFQGRLQLIVQDLSPLTPDQYNLEDYIKKSATAPEKMFDDLVKIVQTLEEVYIKDLLLSILYDSDISRRLKLWQAGKSIHHAYQGGLLEHILSCTNLANNLSAHYKVNRSYVVAGSIMHDMCKIYELTEGPMVDYTDEGKLIGHLSKGVELLDHFSSKIKNFPYAMRLHLKHILLSHHGQMEYGSPKVPHTSEAYLVHLIDLMDSKMSSFEQVKKTDSSTGNWSGFIKHLDCIVYKSELPSFTQYISDEESSAPVNTPAPKKEKKPLEDKELKQSMGSLLKGIKIE
jgi:3'-5' exoribonuclease